MDKVRIDTERAAKPGGPYSQGIRFQQLVFVAGTLGIDPATGQLAEGGVEAQVRQALDNITAILEEAGTSLENALKVNVYLRDMGNYASYNEVYGEYFSGMDVPPVRTTVGVGSFVGDIEVEIEAIAYVRE